MCSYRFIFILFFVVWFFGLVFLLRKQQDLRDFTKKMMNGDDTKLDNENEESWKHFSKQERDERRKKKEHREKMKAKEHLDRFIKETEDILNLRRQDDNNPGTPKKDPLAGVKNKRIKTASEFEENLPPPQLFEDNENDNGKDLPEDNDEPPSLPFLTLFLTPRDGDDIKMKIQQQTLIALHFLKRYGVNVLVFDFESKQGSPKSKPRWRETATQLNITVLTDFPVNPHGTPFLKPMFKYVEDNHPSTFVGYLNADILFSKDLIETLHALETFIQSGKLKERVLVVGRRTNVPMTSPGVREFPSTSKQYLTAWFKDTARRGTIFMQWAMDYFIIKPHTFDWEQLPDYVIGRPWYDMLLTHHAIKNDNIDAVDVSRTAVAIHQTGNDGNFAGQRTLPDSNWNVPFVGKHPPKNIGAGENSHMGSTDYCNYKTVKKDRKIQLFKRGRYVRVNGVMWEILDQ